MQRIMGQLRRAVTDYQMIAPHDSIAVGVSGGKDSLALLTALARSRGFLVEGGFSLFAVSVDMGLGGDFDKLQALCDSLSVPLYIEKTQIAEIVFSARRETNPCSLCSKMRRGALVNRAQQLGCNRLALGHHLDDAVETFMLSLTREGRISCFEPMTLLEDKGITVIRPLIYAEESEISRAIRREGIEIEKSRCPIDGTTARQQMKERLREEERRDRGLKARLFGALCRSGVCGWKIPDSKRRQ